VDDQTGTRRATEPLVSDANGDLGELDLGVEAKV